MDPISTFILLACVFYWGFENIDAVFVYFYYFIYLGVCVCVFQLLFELFELNVFQLFWFSG